MLIWKKRLRKAWTNYLKETFFYNFTAWFIQPLMIFFSNVRLCLLLLQRCSLLKQTVLPSLHTDSQGWSFSSHQKCYHTTATKVMCLCCLPRNSIADLTFLLYLLRLQQKEPLHTVRNCCSKSSNKNWFLKDICLSKILQIEKCTCIISNLQRWDFCNMLIEGTQASGFKLIL